MRIAIDATCWANGRGYGRYTRQVLPELAALAPEDEFLCLLDARSAEVFNLDAPNIHRVVVPLSQSPTEAASADNSRSPADMFRLTRALWRLHPDVFFSPSVYTYFPLPPFLRAVVTVHDAIAERFPELTLPTPRARLFWRMKVGLALRQARLILTVSDFARQEISEMLRVPPARLRVALEAPAPAFSPVTDPAEIRAAAGRAGLPDGAPWFIYVGGFNPHKYVDVLI
ncbi:MAG: glycosyltransferase, partial [Gemmatimonadales bacterium]